ncbi:hypothetical protein HC864_03955 [Candidatus Gracilibacteria bacterium]|nr:hypothetical protein [Candidatus Gracilibacteria bacterium]
MLLASILFYFQVLQPRIINQISLQAQAQSIQISNTFSSQINELAKIQSEILNKNLNSFTEVCNPTQFYNNQDNDQFKIEQLNKKLQPNSDNKNLKNYNIFSQKDIRGTFNKHYQLYESELAQLQQEEVKLKEFLSYKDYKNHWIENCIGFQGSINPNTNIEEICQQQSKLPKSYKELNNLYTELENIEQEQKTLCEDWNNTLLFIPNNEGLFVNNETFKLKWTDLYSKITTLDQEVITSFNAENLNQKIGMFEEKTSQVIDKIIQITKSKKGLINMFYLLDVKPSEIIN